ncbi:hypothetical protein NUQ39_03220 [Glaesserella parasuis]|nr:hypothetical protein [Glaesserella parasuis]
MKIEFPATTGANPIVEGDKVTINYTPELENGMWGTDYFCIERKKKIWVEKMRWGFV